MSYQFHTLPINFFSMNEDSLSYIHPFSTHIAQPTITATPCPPSVLATPASQYYNIDLLWLLVKSLVNTYITMTLKKFLSTDPRIAAWLGFLLLKPFLFLDLVTLIFFFCFVFCVPILHQLCYTSVSIIYLDNVSIPFDVLFAFGDLPSGAFYHAPVWTGAV